MSKINARYVGRQEVSIDALFSFVLDEGGNRCGFLNEEDAEKHGYTAYESKNLLKRAKKYLKSFIKDGYCTFFPIGVVHCLEDNKYYLCDGQGRRAAMQLAKEQGIELPFTTVPVTFYECTTLDDTRDFIRDINTKLNVQWSQMDVVAQGSKMEGGESLDLFNDFRNYQQNIIKTNSEHTPGIIYFDEKWSRMRDNLKYRPENLRPHYKAYKEGYRLFVDNVGNKRFSKLSIKKNREKMVRGQNPCILLNSYFKLIERLSVSLGFNPEEKIIEASKRIIDRWDDGRTNEEKFVKAMTLNKSHKVEFASLSNLDSITMDLFNRKDQDLIEKEYHKWVLGKTSSKQE